ncbi:DUF2917 domain-containing protein [Robbsia sp. Bb-Pol-6]|uniref:DUF2917 domain-containing protein n=1 Tax=Robbsia betulipollinis TaxID=2981849 RepID=A0ABT3ZPX7_9BURK|nr:DUF2917 domain-containing protein [Robbsia betulipollinis]MCY0388594.1 DUF2917 domain-containing protein [Robbsia betulipollinis]
MRQIQHYQLDARQCALFETRSRTTFVLGQGHLWVTIEGESADHWLAAGDSLDVAAGRGVWLGADSADTCLDILQERQDSRPRLTALVRASARHLRRHVRMWHRNTTQRLNPGA